MAEKGGSHALATNRRAFSSFNVLERHEAGVCLLGSEVKSIRAGGLDFRDAWVDHRAGELFVVGLRIAPYSHANTQNHSENRDRKLLLHRREIDRLAGKVSERGLTIIPLKAYFKNGKVKLEIGLGRGRKVHDAREKIRRREMDRETEQELRRRR